MTMKLLVGGGAPIAGGVVGAGGEFAWPKPTRPGDALQVTSEVLEITPSRSRPNRGMVTMRSETRNQQGDVVQVLTAKLVVPRRAQTGFSATQRAAAIRSSWSIATKEKRAWKRCPVTRMRALTKAPVRLAERPPQTPSP